MFLLPVPNADLEAVKEKLVRYRKASALSQGLLASITYQNGGSAGEKCEGILLTLEGAGLFYTEHPERNAMISFAAALGKRKDLQERLGRWRERQLRALRADVQNRRSGFPARSGRYRLQLQALKDFVLKKGVSGSDLPRIPSKNQRSHRSCYRLALLFVWLSGMGSDGYIILRFSGLSSPAPLARVMSVTTMICRPQRITTKFVANAGRMGRPRQWRLPSSWTSSESSSSDSG